MLELVSLSTPLLEEETHCGERASRPFEYERFLAGAAINTYGHLDDRQMKIEENDNGRIRTYAGRTQCLSRAPP